MKDIVHQAFWDSLQGELSSDPPNYSHALVLLQEVKTVSSEENSTHKLEKLHFYKNAARMLSSEWLY